MFVTAQKRRLSILKNSTILAYAAIIISTAIYQLIMNSNYDREVVKVLAAVEHNERATDGLIEYLDTLATGQLNVTQTYCESYKKITQKLYNQPYDCYAPEFRR
jgi:hypothetical protein